ncbi:Grass carp reovirus (GCRV)-induced gene, partial [Pristimantis euphronides]
MFHGTYYEAAKEIIKHGFIPSKNGMLGKGVYVSRDINKARKFPQTSHPRKVVLKLRVNVGRVKKIDRQNHRLQKTWHDHGYDTAWVPPHCGMNPSGQEEDCVYDPRRIKVVDMVCIPLTILSFLTIVIMAYYFGISSNNTENIWREESLPSFEEVVLQSTDQPLDGKIYVMYHGTTYPAAVEIIKNGFLQSKDGMLGRGVYISRDENKALRYPLDNKNDQVILKLRVNVGKVKKIDYQNHPLQKTWHEKGYDTAWVPEFCGMVKSQLEEDCVWDPRRIKVVGIAKASPQHLLQLNYLTFFCFFTENMAYGYNEDFWEEERLPNFCETCLCGNDRPRNGKIYVMYHGTTLDAAIQIIQDGFKRSQNGLLGKGVYVSRDIQKAACYPQDDRWDQVILKLRVNVGRVKVIDRQYHPLQKRWHTKGYDTAWVPQYSFGREEDCIWNPKRIKVVGIARSPPLSVHKYLNKFLELCTD